MALCRLTTALGCLSKLIERTAPRILVCTERYVSRKNCAKIIEPRCSKKALAKTKCMKDKKKKAAKKHKKHKKFPFKHLIYHEECCRLVCPDPWPRFDDIYYKESDKLKRKYTQTWVTCKTPKRRRKPTCRFDGRKVAYKKRSRKDRPKTACPAKKPKSSKGCTRVALPGCRVSRIPPRCFLIKEPSKCKKRCTQYPSFSECKHKPLRKPKPTECGCLRSVSVCEVFLLQKKQLEKPKS